VSFFDDQRKAAYSTVRETTLRLFVEKGYDNVTIEEITKTIGIAKGTFYSFFKTKFEVLEAWAADALMRVVSSTRPWEKQSFEENIFRAVKVFSDEVAANPGLFHAFFRESSLIPCREDDQRFDFRSLFDEILRDSKNAPAWKDEERLDRASVMNSVLSAGALEWFASEKAPKEKADGFGPYLGRLARICLSGISG
jgi:AcrR family transcriptional regulator